MIGTIDDRNQLESVKKWLIANGVDLRDVVHTPIDVDDVSLTYTYFAPDSSAEGYVKERRTVPLVAQPETFGLT